MDTVICNLRELAEKEVKKAVEKIIAQHTGTIVNCGLEECEHNRDGICTTDEISLDEEHCCNGGCDYGWKMEDEDEDEDEEPRHTDINAEDNTSRQQTGLKEYQRGWNDALNALQFNIPCKAYNEFEKCGDCIHSGDSEAMCILRQCVHAVKTKECFEPKKVDREKGKWIPYKYRSLLCDIPGEGTWVHDYRCSKCGFIHTVTDDIGGHLFCPHCGADMREGDHE